jgi:mitochondrial splicing suppressor protein 51
MAITTSSAPLAGTGDSHPASPKISTASTTTGILSESAATTAVRRPSPSAGEPASRSASHHPDATSSSQPNRHPTRSAPAEFLSDRATAALIRRCLCARHLADRGRGSPAPIQDLLPPLTSRNDVDLQLYALISIILREFVQNWYSKITPDETFVAEIVQVIAHCTRALEQRLRKVDLESLLFDELPELLATHIRSVYPVP